MKHLPCRATKHCQMILSALVTLIFTVGATAAWAQTTAFTYQGKLNNGGVPANGTFEMQFRLLDALAGGAQVGTPFTDSSVAVVNGIFTTTLDFPEAAAFDGSARWLEIGIRPAGDPNPFTILSPRQPINSTPYAIRSANAANATQLGGVDASQYVTTTTGAMNFIQNATTQQASANFNISGNGLFGGNVGIGLNPEVGFKFDVNGAGVFRTGNGRINFSSPSGETGMSIIPNSVNRADVRFDGLTLKLNAGLGTTAPCCGIAINTLGNVGIGTTSPFLNTGGTGRLLSISDSNNPGLALTNTGFGGRQFFLYSGGSGNFRIFDATSAADRLTLDATGNVGIGTTTPAHRLSLIGGPLWTSNLFTGALELGNASAIGWRANAAGNRFGIGQTTGGLTFFATLSDPGTTVSPANYVLQITDTGNVVQPINNNGLVKAMIYVAGATAQIIRCFNSVTNSTTGDCGINVSHTPSFPAEYHIDFPFQVDNRFISVSVKDGFNANFGVTFDFAPFQNNRLTVKTFIPGGQFHGDPSDFMVIVY